MKQTSNKLFIVTEEGEVDLNTEWIRLIPQFNALFDSRVAYKKQPKPRKTLAYIYFMEDFSSPIISYPEKERNESALGYTGLTEEDVTVKAVIVARTHYRELAVNRSRALKSYHSAMTALDKMDSYFEVVDFAAVDKMGRQKYTPNQFVDNISKMNKAYDELDKMKMRIKTELESNTGIRGTAELSDKEIANQNNPLKTRQGWKEGGSDGPASTDNSPGAFDSLGSFLRKGGDDEIA